MLIRMYSFLKHINHRAKNLQGLKSTQISQNSLQIKMYNMNMHTGQNIRRQRKISLLISLPRENIIPTKQSISRQGMWAILSESILFLPLRTFVQKRILPKPESCCQPCSSIFSIRPIFSTEIETASIFIKNL